MSGNIVRALTALGGILAVVWSAQRATLMNPIPETAPVRLREIAKLAEEQPTHGGILHTDKARGPLASSIERVGSTHTQMGEAMLLEATVVATKSVEGAAYRWQLPPGVHLISGVASGEIRNIDPKQPFKVQATFQQSISGNKQIHFIATAKQNGLEFAAVSQFNSLNEDLIRDQRQTILRALKNAPKSSAMH